MLQIGAALDAFLATALDTAASFCHSAFLVHAGDALGRFHPFQRGVKPGLHAAFLTAGVGGVQILGQPVGRQGGFFRAKGRAQHALSFSGDELLLPADHDRFVYGKPREQSFRRVKSGTQQVEFCRVFPESTHGVNAPVEGNIHSLQGLH